MTTCAVILYLFTAITGAQSTTADDEFHRAGDLRSRGQFESAIEILNGVIADHENSGPVLRRAYNQLVWTVLARSDDVNERARLATDPDEAQKLRDTLDSIARELGNVVGEALTRFPDLRADDDLPDPSRVNQAYEPARQRMFGNLVVQSTPDSAAVWIKTTDEQWNHAGWTPLRRNLFPVGSYEIRLSKSGYKDTEVMSRIGPNETTQLDVGMPQRHSRTWWLTRVGLPVAGAVGVLVYALTAGGDDGGPADPDPLPLPPDPPSQ